MIPVTACTHCQTLSLNPVGVFCARAECRGVHRPVKGLLFEPLDIGALLAGEGDAIIQECARALELLSEKRRDT